MASGLERIVLATPRLIAAPNWAPDGASLIVNGEGRLWRVRLDSPDLALIDTGSAARLNNDHAPSPDGARIAISHHVVPGQSCIYLIPSGGGEPERVTERTPSWLHGWSPDGRRIAYAAVRNGAFGIFTCRLDGRDETEVAGGGGHHDGPDFTPDGSWIWFNSDQGDGGMQLWRVRPDGSARERMTHDARVNWFPHPSPDGRCVLYLSYAPGTEGHPADVDVELRLIPADGGVPQVVRCLFGGQGSVNVPCWSPDGRAFAFVRYRPKADDGEA
jgi:Tol biopolymer transport system component